LKFPSAPPPKDAEDLVFMNYTYKRFEGLTQRVAPKRPLSAVTAAAAQQAAAAGPL